MPKPSAQELLQQITERDKVLGQSFRALIEEVVEMHAKDMAMIESLHQHVANWETELAEAKAEGGAWMRRCDELERLLAVQKASIADAEIGQLVRGMGQPTRLTRSGFSYSAQILTTHEGGWHSANHAFTLDPAEALRAIQEVGDAGT